MKVSVCFPYRADGGHRDALAAWTKERWETLFPEYELVYGECDDRYPFNRSQAINDAVARSSGDILIVADADVMFFPEFVLEAVRRVVADPLAWGFAFDQYKKLTRENTRWLLHRTPRSGLPLRAANIQEESQSTLSGLMVISRRAFTIVGGFDEGFVGWGFEDAGFSHTATERLGPFFRVEGGYVLHMWHESADVFKTSLANNKRFDAVYLGVKTPEVLNVGLYSAWDEPFEDLHVRLRWATPGLSPTTNWFIKDRGSAEGFDTSRYKNLRFVPPEETHEYALVFNAAENLRCRVEKAYVIIFEPPEIIGFDNPWLTHAHPQDAGHVFMFGGGSVHPPVLGLHIPQAMLSTPDMVPSAKPFRASMFCSKKAQTPYQVQRRKILSALLQTELDIRYLGRGMQPSLRYPRIGGELTGLRKDNGVRPYTFTIDFENAGRDVLTDKFLDPILSGTVPITNSTGAAKVFPEGSFEYVDFDWPIKRIVGRIGEIVTQPAADLIRYDQPITAAKELVSTGPLNICEWLYRQIEAR